MDPNKRGSLIWDHTVKPVLSGHSKKDKTKILITNGSLMKVKVLQNAPLGAFCNTFDLHQAIISLENQLGLHFKWSLQTGFTVMFAL